jgi:hypothetical protein
MGYTRELAMKLEVPFFSNTPDNFHCFQAALRMVLAYYIPGRTYDWEELDRVTAHTANYTWPSAGLLYCASIGFILRVIDDLDYERFCLEGYDYLVELAGKEIAEDQRINSDLPQEMRYAKQLIATLPVEKRIPSRIDITECLEKGMLVVCNVNLSALDNKAGYTAHFVVAIGANDRGIWLHDPGLPPRQNEFIQWNRFEPAWSYPDERARNIMAFRLVT